MFSTLFELLHMIPHVDQSSEEIAKKQNKKKRKREEKKKQLQVEAKAQSKQKKEVGSKYL